MILTNETDLWSSYDWQMENQITDLAGLEPHLNLTEQERIDFEQCDELFKVRISPYWLSLMDKDNPNCPIRRQSLPNSEELTINLHDKEDPLNEEADMKVPGLTHRYPDRVLLYAVNVCAMYCRHCTRKRKVSSPSSAVRKQQLQGAINYIREHTEVRDIVVSGGDPLSLDDETLDWLLGSLRAIPHVEIIRLGTRMPCTMPFRITDAFVEMVKKHHPIFVNTQFNHPRECTAEAKAACERLVNAGCVVGNQTVLLKGVNDDPEIIKTLNKKLLTMRVRPYYLYMCDLSRGIGHFRTSLDKAMEIMKALRGWTSGLAVPAFVIDAPGGGGKIPILPNYVKKIEGDKVVMVNYKGDECTYFLGETSKIADNVESVVGM
jgi:lysine 2,3-aminomutase